MLEVELKYKLDKLPDSLKELDCYYIEQYYFNPSKVFNYLESIFGIFEPNDFTTYRLRKITFNNNISYVVTLKSKGLSSRIELEKEVNKDLFEILVNQEIKSFIYKKRIKHLLNGYNFEFDEYYNINVPLITVEVELCNTNDISKHQKIIEDILDKYYKVQYIDVTIDPKYKNSNLHLLK